MELTMLSFIGPWQLLVVLLPLAYLITWIYCLVQVLTNNFEGENTRIIWVLVLLLLPLIGVFLFLLIGKNQISRQ